MLKRSSRRFRWMLIVSAAIVIVGYFAAPHIVWFWRTLGRIDAATTKASVVIGESAADWQTIDLAGTQRSLADYRGQVVVLDFWYAGCGWCMRGMPQMVALADEFKDQPVAVLGVNRDSEIDEAQRVVGYFGIDYPTLRDEHGGMAEMYRITMWPSAIVLDQQGVVRHVHCGYWPTMQRSVSRKVRALLADDQPSPVIQPTKLLE